MLEALRRHAAAIASAPADRSDDDADDALELYDAVDADLRRTKLASRSKSSEQSSDDDHERAYRHRPPQTTLEDSSSDTTGIELASRNPIHYAARDDQDIQAV